MSDVRPRKRAQQERSRQTVAAIVEAAARILAEGGTGAVTTNALARRAGVSVGSLYQYFPNREAVLAELLRGKLQRLLAALEEAAAVPDFAAAVHAMLLALSRSYLERPALARALVEVEALVADDAEVSALRAALGRTVTGFLAGHGVARPDVAARDVVAMARGMALAAGLAGERDAQALVARMSRAVHGYLDAAP